MSTTRVRNLNELLGEFWPLLEFLRESPAEVKKLRVDWQGGYVRSAPGPVKEFLKTAGLITEEDSLVMRLSGPGLSLISKLLIDYSQLKGKTVGGRYLVRDRVAEGTESVAFDGVHQALKSHLCLKIFRPGQMTLGRAYETRLGEVEGSNILVLPTDVIDVELKDVTGQSSVVPCLVYPFITHPTFSAFIKKGKAVKPLFHQRIHC